MFRTLVIISAVMAIFQVPLLQVWMQWDNDLIASGQIWRIVTGNFTHTNIYHLSMNLVGLWLITSIFRSEFHSQTFIWLVMLLSASIGLLLLTTPTQVYVGFSGVLHGLFGFYAVKEWRGGNKSSLILTIGLIVKILWEQLLGSPTGSEQWIGAIVAINAHLFGAATGIILAFFSTKKLWKNALKRTR